MYYQQGYRPPDQQPVTQRRPGRGRKKALITVIALVLGAAILTAGGLLGLRAYRAHQAYAQLAAEVAAVENQFLPHTIVDGIDLGGMTAQEGIDAVLRQIESRQNSWSLKLTYQGHVFYTLSYDTLGVRTDIGGVYALLQELYQKGKMGTLEERKQALDQQRETPSYAYTTQSSATDQQLDSILSQSFRDLEIICVDDDSDDASADILQEYVDREPRVHATSFQRRLGTVVARKLALLDARGKYVMFADADDWLLPGACETAVKLIEELKTDIVQFTIDFEAEQKDAEALDAFRRVFRARAMESNGTNILYDCFVNHRFLHNLWNKIYRAEICREAVDAMPDIRLHHYTDQYLSFFILFFAKSFRSVLTKPCYRYHFGGGVSTKTPDAVQFRDVCEVSKALPLMEKFLRDRNAYETNISVLDAIRNTIQKDIVGKLLTIPTLTREIIFTAIEYWGSDIIFDFLNATGMFRYPIDNRMSLVSGLVERNRANQR